jgi:hypothetical protein
MPTPTACQASRITNSEDQSGVALARMSATPLGIKHSHPPQMAFEVSLADEIGESQLGE